MVSVSRRRLGFVSASEIEKRVNDGSRLRSLQVCSLFIVGDRQRVFVSYRCGEDLAADYVRRAQALRVSSRSHNTSHFPQYPENISLFSALMCHLPVNAARCVRS